MDVKGVYRPTDEEHEAFLKEVAPFCGDDLPSRDEHEACRIMTAYDNGELPAESIAWVASSSNVTMILHDMAEDRALIAPFIRAAYGKHIG